MSEFPKEKASVTGAKIILFTHNVAEDKFTGYWQDASGGSWCYGEWNSKGEHYNGATTLRIVEPGAVLWELDNFPILLNSRGQLADTPSEAVASVMLSGPVCAGQQGGVVVCDALRAAAARIVGEGPADARSSSYRDAARKLAFAVLGESDE